MGPLWYEGKREGVTEWKSVFVQRNFYWLLGNIWRWDVSILAPCILCYEVWLFQMDVWLWNIGCQRRRGLCGERNYKDMAVVIGTQCYFHVAAFYWPFGHWDKWAVKWLGIYWQTLVINDYKTQCLILNCRIWGPQMVFVYVLFGFLICVLCYLWFNNMLLKTTKKSILN